MEPIKKLLVAALLLAGVALLPAAPATAAASDAEPYARVVYPLVKNNPKGNMVRVIIEGPTSDWGFKAFAKSVDASFPGLKVRMHGGCAARPTWVCVRVTVGSWDPDQQVALAGINFMGLTTYPAYNMREVYLNSFYTPISAYAVAAHEFGHVLGLNHHMQDGVCGALPDVTVLGAAEDAVLRPYYG